MDGIRGIAVFLVLVEHYYPHGQARGGIANIFLNGLQNLMQTGRVGVVVFFVLSGILITGILLRLSASIQANQSTGFVAWRTFVIRRSFRIFPVYFLAIAVFLSLMPDYRYLWPWLVSYTVNVGQVMTALGMAEAHFGQMGHFWTLAIEEQFYLLIPLAIVFLPRNRALPLIVLLAILSMAAAIVLPFEGLSYDASSRLSIGGCSFALLTGALIAFRAHMGLDLQRPKRILLFVGTPIYLYLTYVWYNHHGVDGIAVGYLAFLDVGIATFSAGLILHVMTNRNLSQRIDNPVLVGLGRISYGLYVYHALLIPFFPTILKYFFDMGLPSDYSRGFRFFLFETAIAVSLALVSYFAIERPILNYRDRRFPMA